MDEIKVTVVKFPDRTNRMLRYIDPVTSRQPPAAVQLNHHGLLKPSPYLTTAHRTATGLCEVELLLRLRGEMFRHKTIHDTLKCVCDNAEMPFVAPHYHRKSVMLCFARNGPIRTGHFCG